MLEDKELYKGTSRKVEAKWSSRETVNILDSKIYYKAATSS